MYTRDWRWWIHPLKGLKNLHKSGCGLQKLGLTSTNPNFWVQDEDEEDEINVPMALSVFRDGGLGSTESEVYFQTDNYSTISHPFH